MPPQLFAPLWRFQASFGRFMADSQVRMVWKVSVLSGTRLERPDVARCAATLPRSEVW
jgi:hypothetical protein